MDNVIAYQWISVALIFLFGSIWSEDNVRYGYVLVPFMAGFFWFIGWLKFSYLNGIIPLVIFMGIVTYLRSHLRYKYGVFGSGGPLFYTILSYVVLLQFAIVFVNGLAIFNSNYVDIQESDLPDYSLESANTVYSGTTYDLNIADVITGGLTLTWTAFRVFWSMFYGFVTIVPSLQANFGMPASIAVIIGAGLYLLVAIEVFVIIFKPYRPPEV